MALGGGSPAPCEACSTDDNNPTDLLLPSRPCQVCILMDEVSTGLDSATAYSVISSFRDVAHSLRRTMLISLLQVGGVGVV